MSTMNIYDDWGLGYTEEVLHGEIYQPSGVCSHQCWSETNVVHPLITGMLGFAPEALQKTVALFPQLPAHWPRFKAKNLRVGDSRFDLEMTRDKNITWSFTLTGGEPVRILFQVRNDADWRLKTIEAAPEGAIIQKNVVEFLLDSSAQLKLAYAAFPKE